MEKIFYDINGKYCPNMTQDKQYWVELGKLYEKTSFKSIAAD